MTKFDMKEHEKRMRAILNPPQVPAGRSPVVDRLLELSKSKKKPGEIKKRYV